MVFSKAAKIWIVQNYILAHSWVNLTQLRRDYIGFFGITNRKSVPGVCAFKRVKEKFQNNWNDERTNNKQPYSLGDGGVHKILLKSFSLFTDLKDLYMGSLTSKCLKHSASRKGYWFMQDCATAHTTNAILSYLKDKFQGRVVSQQDRLSLAPKEPWLKSIGLLFLGCCRKESLW